MLQSSERNIGNMDFCMFGKCERATSRRRFSVFDDPYHNQDRSRRQCTIEQIHHLTGIAKQCFVLSHDLEFARAVERRPGTQAKTFVVNPLINPATLEAWSLPPLPSQAYLKNYHLTSPLLRKPCRPSWSSQTSCGHSSRDSRRVLSTQIPKSLG